MNFEDFDNGTTDQIKRLERGLTVGSIAALGAPAVIAYLNPVMTMIDAATLWMVVGTGVVVFSEVRRARIDVLRIERTRLLERYTGQYPLDR